MPELPEAETIAKGLDSVLPGRVISKVRVLHPDVIAGPPQDFAAAVGGSRFGRIGRRGKNVILELTDGSCIAVNLGMTGRLLPDGGPGPAPLSTHPAVLFDLEGGGSVTYDDVRRFGRLTRLPAGERRAWSRRLGPEPLARSLTARRFRRILQRSRSPVRSLLLDQRKIAGVGNIYAVEALWGARIHPQRPANDIGDAASARLHRSLRRVLRKAIRARGTTLRDYRTAEGDLGGFGPTLKAYGREGERCPRCRNRIERLVFGGRSAFLCPGCQGGDA